MLFGLLVFGSIVAAVIWFVTAYNTLDAASQRAALAWGNIDQLLRQRHDDIPRLLDLYRQYVTHEQATFDRALEARGAILGARQSQDIAALGRAEQELRVALAHLRGLATTAAAYAADQPLAGLEERVGTLAAGIAERRKLYNEAAGQNNAAISRLPGRVVAGLGGFQRLEPFEFDAG